MKKYLSEGLGVFLLVLIVASASVYLQDALIVSVVVSFGLAFVVMLFQHISGGHVNPAITLGNIVTRKIKPLQGLFYIIAQFAGAAIATVILAKLNLIGGTQTVSTWSLSFAEMVGSLVFGFGVAAASFHKVESSKVSTVVGFSLFFASLICLSLFKLGVILNPAVAFGMAVVSLSALIGPFVGATIGFLLYWFITECEILDMLRFDAPDSPAPMPLPEDKGAGNSKM